MFSRTLQAQFGSPPGMLTARQHVGAPLSRILKRTDRTVMASYFTSGIRKRNGNKISSKYYKVACDAVDTCQADMLRVS